MSKVRREAPAPAAATAPEAAPVVEVVAQESAPVVEAVVPEAAPVVEAIVPEAQAPEVLPTTPDVVEPPKARSFVAVFGGPMIDIDSNVAYEGAPKEGPMTGWLESQIAAGKIKEVE